MVCVHVVEQEKRESRIQSQATPLPVASIWRLAGGFVNPVAREHGPALSNLEDAKTSEKRAPAS
jgi:hypothetical protein